MNKLERCPWCGGTYTYGSALYDYYKCGHALEKPLNNEGKERVELNLLKAEKRKPTILERVKEWLRDAPSRKRKPG